MDAPNVAVRPALITPQKLAVGARGEFVDITIGNSVLTLHYADALLVSQWIRVRAKEAKAAAGDVGRHWSVLAVLDDVTPK